MNYSEVRNKIPKEDFLNFCLTQEKTPAEIGKNLLNLECDIDLWNKAHLEYGKLTDIEERDYPNSSSAIFVAKWMSKRESYGKYEREARSNFLGPTDPILTKWKDCLNKFCRFYISYAENSEDGSVFRVLLDIEPADNQ